MTADSLPQVEEEESRRHKLLMRAATVYRCAIADMLFSMCS